MHKKRNKSREQRRQRQLDLVTINRTKQNTLVCVTHTTTYPDYLLTFLSFTDIYWFLLWSLWFTSSNWYYVILILIQLYFQPNRTTRLKLVLKLSACINLNEFTYHMHIFETHSKLALNFTDFFKFTEFTDISVTFTAYYNLAVD